MGLSAVRSVLKGVVGIIIYSGMKMSCVCGKPCKEEEDRVKMIEADNGRVKPCKEEDRVEMSEADNVRVCT